MSTSWTVKSKAFGTEVKIYGKDEATTADSPMVTLLPIDDQPEITLTHAQFNELNKTVREYIAKTNPQVNADSPALLMRTFDLARVGSGLWVNGEFAGYVQSALAAREAFESGGHLDGSGFSEEEVHRLVEYYLELPAVIQSLDGELQKVALDASVSAMKIILRAEAEGREVDLDELDDDGTDPVSDDDC